ncbi:MAG: hypothetical protein QXK94_04840 [Candidatus Jordarchaeales archaeon]
MIDEVLAMVETGKVNPADVDLKALLVEVREARSGVEWGEKISKLIRLARLKVRALIESVILRFGKPPGFGVTSPLVIPWIGFSEAERALRELVEAMSKRMAAKGGDETSPALLVDKETVELHVAEERKYREYVQGKIRELGEARLEDLLEGDILERASIFVEVLRLISEGVLGYDKLSGRVFALERV